MINVAVFTGTRAEYGLLYWLLKDIQKDDELNLQLIVSAMHLSPEFGLTKNHIEEDGFVIDEQVEMLLSSDSSVGCAKSVGLGVIGFSDSLQRLKPDVLIVLGDRFEALSVSQTAMLMNIPIAHIHGGEITEGAKDDVIRHAITKFSTFHFTAAQAYSQRIIQLGESPERVFNVGAIGLEHGKRSTLLSKEDLSSSIAFPLNQYIIVTYHPATLANEDAIESCTNLLSALSQFSHLQVLISYPNADDGGRKIIPLLEQYANENSERVLLIKSLGSIRYLSALKHACVVVGNSSSGIIEAPMFNTPTVNIGDRQKGRLAANSVIHCNTEKQSIIDGINVVIENDFISSISPVTNPYGSGDSSKSILHKLKTLDLKQGKSFYDLPKHN